MDNVASTGESAREMLGAAGDLSRQSALLSDEVARFLEKVRAA